MIVNMKVVVVAIIVGSDGNGSMSYSGICC